MVGRSPNSVRASPAKAGRSAVPMPPNSRTSGSASSLSIRTRATGTSGLIPDPAAASWESLTTIIGPDDFPPQGRLRRRRRGSAADSARGFLQRPSSPNRLAPTPVEKP